MTALGRLQEACRAASLEKQQHSPATTQPSSATQQHGRLQSVPPSALAPVAGRRVSGANGSTLRSNDDSGAGASASPQQQQQQRQQAPLPSSSSLRLAPLSASSQVFPTSVGASDGSSSYGLPSHSPGAPAPAAAAAAASTGGSRGVGFRPDAPPSSSAAAAAASVGTMPAQAEQPLAQQDKRKPPPPPASAAAAAPAAAPAPTKAPVVTAAVIAGIGDLQRAGPAALQAAKARMQVLFDAKAIPRDAPDFEYDKRVEFKPEEPSEWD
jgi:hypothetical protein